MNKRFTRSEILFLTAYTLWFIFAAINLTYFKTMFPLSDIRKAVEKVVILLLVLKLIEDNGLYAKTLLGLGVVGLVFAACRNTELTEFLLLAFFIFSMRNVDYRDVFKISIVVHLIVMVITVSCSASGLLPNEVWGEFERDRYDWGYTYCTYGSHIMLFITLMYMSLKKTLKLWQAALVLGLNILWFFGNDTQTDLFLFIAAIAMVYLASVFHLGFSDRRIARVLYGAVGPVLAGVALWAQFHYDETNPRWKELNAFLHNRLSLGYNGIETYGIPLWGQKVKWVGAGGAKAHPDWVYNYVDSAFLKYLIHYGIIFTILLLLGLVLMGIFVADSKNPGLQVAFLIWLAFGMVDAEFLALSFHPIMLLLGVAFNSYYSQMFVKDRQCAGSLA